MPNQKGIYENLEDAGVMKKKTRVTSQLDNLISS